VTFLPSSDSRLGTLALDEVYEFHDGPVVFSCVNDLGYKFFGLAVDHDSRGDAFAYVPVSNDRLLAISTGRISMREALAHPETETIFIVRPEAPNGPEVEECQASEIPDEWLPGPTQFLAPAVPTESNHVREKTRSVGSTAGDFFIVDNSDEHWKALEYLRQWCALSAALDIATGYFEVGALLALDGEWQKVDTIRILIGSETSRQTADAIAEARNVLERSLADTREYDPFLEGLDGIIAAIRAGKIQIRVYRRKKFHAKAYITHGRLDVVGSAALVGSSNFTPAGLTRNVELNVRFTGVEVRELQSWYEEHWADGEEANADILQVLERHARTYTPFEVYAKALQALTDDVEPGATEWERSRSKIYPLLAPYQREGYHGLKQRATKWKGAFLTDGVGLGKTFVGLMLTEYFAVKERKNVLILATKTGQDAVWEPELARLLPELSGEFTNVRVMAHTDLSRQDAQQRVERLAERADVVIVDEAHNFRNHGSRGDDDDSPKSRWWRLQELCAGKTVFLLTATPINNTLFDFVHEFELFTGLDDAYFATLGVASVRGYVTNLEQTFLRQVGGHVPNDRAPMMDLVDFETLMHQDKLLEALIVQNSRQYAQKSALAAGGSEVLFPTPDLPRAVPYNYNLAFSALLSEMEKAFQRANPLFVLPMYFPLAYSTRPEVDTRLENRQRQVVGLIRTTFLKRFESSIAAFAGSCADLAVKVVTWIRTNSDSMPQYRERADAWVKRNADLLQEVHDLFRPGVEPADIEFDDDNDEQLFDEVGVSGEALHPDEYDLVAMFDAAFEDLVQLTSFLERVVTVGKINDDKYDQLLALLAGGARAKGKDRAIFDRAFAEQKVLVFTEYADTARYLHDRLLADGIHDVDRLDGSRKGNRLAMIQRFAPHYNRVDEWQRLGLSPLRVLVSTDVLAEGVNLQDATLIVNYDIHWNPVRLMQRIGRVDRRLDAGCEAAIVAENPKTKATRGAIQVRNFLPPDELNRILSLYTRVQNRVLLISKTLGIPGGRLLTEDDMLDDVRVFTAFLEEYQGDVSPIEALRLRFLNMISDHSGLESLLDEMPLGSHTTRDGEPVGLFLCSVEPIRSAPDDAQPVWTLEEGQTRWAFRRSDGEVITDVTQIDTIIQAELDTQARTITDHVIVRDQLHEWQRERHTELMKEAGLPLDAPKPLNVCWMYVQ
jgi:superfamily II DNA or RNA helicase